MTVVSEILGANDVLRELIGREHEVVSHYDSAADQLEQLETKVALDSFRAQHAQHAKALGDELEQRQSLAPAAPAGALPPPAQDPILWEPPDEREALKELRRMERMLEDGYLLLLERGDIETPLRELVERILAEQRSCTTWLEDHLLLDQNRH